MIDYNDRGRLKWAGFYLSDHTGVLPTKSGKHTLSKIRHKESRFFLR
ncbi:TPA: hypothetical protein LQB44_002417 [Enterococcus faecium]|nr:hypothetical protein [Enterococcus faecium]